MKVHGLLLDCHAGGVERRHDGRIAMAERNRRRVVRGLQQAAGRSSLCLPRLNDNPENTSIFSGLVRWRIVIKEILQ
jgi:hypothetical protein